MFPDVDQRTPLDLNFSIFHVAVRVHPLHWLTSAFLGWDLFRDAGLVALLIWIACVFVSVLLHELGHVFAGWYFGSKGHILLASFGGLAIGSNNQRQRWKRIAVLAAGPAIQFVFYGLLWLARPFLLTWMDDQSRYVKFTYYILMGINFWWPLFNLLPIYPLDGGQISRELLEGA